MLERIDNLRDEDRQMVLGLLRCVANHDAAYHITVHPTHSKSKPYAVRIQFDDGFAPVLAQPFNCTSDPFHRLFLQELVELVGSPEERAYRFADEIVSEYIQTRRLSDVDVRRLICEELYRDWSMAPAANYRGRRINVSAFCQRTGIKVDRFETQAHMLIKMKRARFSGHAENTVEEGYIALAEPKGFEWAEQGFPDVLADRSTSVTVDVQISIHVLIREFIGDIESLDIDNEEKRQIRETAEEFERHPTWTLVQQLMEFGANSLVVLPFIYRLITQSQKIIDNLK